MTAQAFRPWTDLVKLHPDVEAKTLTESLFAIDLGAIAENDPNVPVVYRDADAFFRATYLTADLRKLLEEVLSSLSGKPGFNRVLKLRTPFGGGKSHTLATLLHAARTRSALSVIPEGSGFDDPGKVDVAVFDGEKFDALYGKTLPDEQQIRTMWGWIAWQFGEEKYKLVADHDRDRVAPGGDVIREVLSGTPKLILLDEVLKYMERSAGVGVLDSTLQRQTKDFFQNLTVEVANSTNAVLVYSLQWSARESLGNVALLQEIDGLANRVDQLREPVSGDEILPILQRRLLAQEPPKDAARQVAEAFSQAFGSLVRANAETNAQQQQANEDALALRNRMLSAYPFHPDLIDVMKERWASVDAFQRTRGALRFLAACLGAAKRNGDARTLLGPGDIPISDGDVRLQLQKELGLQNEYDAVITSDISGPNARAKRIDDRLGRETPALGNARPATRIATAIFVYSFGGLRREAAGEEETLPPGVTESELLRACVSPDLDYITAKAVLADLRTECLFLHFDGAHYCFKKDPNVTKLIEDAEQEVSRNAEAVSERIRDILGQKLAGHTDAFIWPKQSLDLSDGEPRFLLGFLPLDFASKSRTEQEREAVNLFSKYGDKPRRYRNGIGLVVPDKKQIESLRRAVRYLIAVERVETKKAELRLSKNQTDQLKERKGTEEAAKESALRGLYNAVWLPRVENGALAIEPLDVGGRPLQSTGVYERAMELLTVAGKPKLFDTVHPRKLMERVKLGEAQSEGEPARLGIPAHDVLDSFYEVIEPPRLSSSSVLRKAIARGVSESLFGYCSGATPTLSDGGSYQVSLVRVAIGRPIAEDEVDFDSGFLMMPSAIPQPEAVKEIGTDETPQTGEETPTDTETTKTGGTTTTGEDTTPVAQPKTSVVVKFKANREKLFKSFPAIANLADKSEDGKISIEVTGVSQAGFDESWLRNAVDEPLDEADVERE